MNPTPSKRVAYLDIAKGIGILLVILGHCTAIPEWLNHLVFSVHMPLFFILSGYTFRGASPKAAALSRDSSPQESAPAPAPSSSRRAFIRKNAKALLVPYAITCLIIIILQLIDAFRWHQDPWNALVKWVMSGLYGSGTRIPEFFGAAGIPITFIGAIWFLPALFFGKVILSYCLNSRTPLLWVLVSFFAGQITSERIGWFPFSIQAGMCAVLFLYIGYRIRQRDLFRWNAVHGILKILMLGIWICCILYCGRLYMVSNTYTDGLLDVIGSVCGTFVIVYISQGIEKAAARWPRLLHACCGLGRISLGMMCAHLIVLDCLQISAWADQVSWVFHTTYVVGEVLVVFLASFLVTAILYVIPWINRWFFPSSVKKRR